MNELTTTRSEISFGLVPTNMAEAMRLAEMMATAKLVPRELQKSPADCLMVIQQAIRWEMDPFAVAQECSVIQGKLMHSGKLVAAVINARGNLHERLAFTYEGEGDERIVTVSGRLQGELEPRTVKVKFKDAKTNAAVWKTQPDQQLAYHGARVWARRHAPELMLGVWAREEFNEEPAAPRRPPTAAPNVMLPKHDPDTGEIIDPPSTPADAAPPADPPHDTPAPTGADAGGAVLSNEELDLRAMTIEEMFAMRVTLGMSVEDVARQAAKRGEVTFTQFYRARDAGDKQRINIIGNELRGIMS